ncbi:MAG TPA: CDP-alcohol phosphatidyltransferase family protein [Candidatus Nanoarchaeia archaeon]|nr:CDP-alcohol phosphatidyltransferase family protein [Candidatus Nanoarchaeia archaeon]
MAESKIFTIPNLLSLSRIPLAILLVYGIFTGNPALMAVSAILAALSDMLDGNIARYYNHVTKLGARLDIVCDKVFLLLAVIALIIANYAPYWQLLLLGSKEIIVVVGSLYLYLKGNFTWQKVSSKFWGKANTALQFIAVFSLVVFPLLWPYLLALTVISSVIALYQYRKRLF